MSETTLTTDGMALAAELRAYWPPTQGTHPAPVRFRSSSIEQDITVATVIERLCDAAARAETLEAVRNVPPLTDEEVDAFLASTEEPKEPTPHE